MSDTKLSFPIATTAKIQAIDVERGPGLSARSFRNDRNRAADRCKGLFSACPADFHGEKHCQPATQCGSKFVSVRSLPKMGIFRKLTGDFREILSKVAAIWSLETAIKCT
jgi:hypothetical protein